MENDNANKDRDEELKRQLEKEVQKVEGELDDLKGLFGQAEEAKATFDAEETRLKGILTTLENDSNASVQDLNDA